jgi:homoserine O-acetyltransferase/O-succinyltransferase
LRGSTTSTDLLETTDQSALPGYELIGPAGAPIMIALGGISAHRHVVSNDDDPTPGWWESVAGPSRALDPTRFRILGIDYCDGGVTGDGRPREIISTHDQADALVALLRRLAIPRVHAIIGASYGGMVALAFAERYPHLLERLVIISAAHESHPFSTGLRALQRRIVELGLETGHARQALVLARGIAMTTYRTAREFGERFGAPLALHDGGDVTFPIEQYLLHCGETFAARFSPERFLALSLSTDLHRVDPSAITTPTVLVAAEGDTLVPDIQMQQLASRLGGPRRLLHVPTRYGHDAFLTEPIKIGRILSAAIRGTVLS